MFNCPTRATLQASARLHLEDASIGRTWKNWQLNKSINAVLKDIHSTIVELDKGWFEQTISMGLTEGVALYTLPSDICRIKKVELFSSGNQIVELTRVWASQIIRGTETGTPLYYFPVGRRQIGIYPVPNSTQAFVSHEGGPLRINYIEAIPHFVELDHPKILTEAFEDTTDDQLLNEYETFGLSHQIYTGPAISYGFERIIGDDQYLPERTYKLIALFVKRDEKKSRYSVPECIGMPWQSPYSAPALLDGDSCKLHITKWPKGDPDNNQWPDDATHLDLWLYVSGKEGMPIGPWNPVSGNNYHDVCFLGNILPDDDYADGDLIFTAFGGATVPLEVGEEGPGIWDGRYTDNLETVGTGDGGGFFYETQHMARWISQIPPTPFPHPERWAPYDVNSAYVNAPNTGSGIYHDTNPARGDADIIHEDMFLDHVDLIGTLVAIHIMSTHGIVNEMNLARRKELLGNLRNYYASRNPGRIINITNPDSNTIPRHRLRNHPDMRR